MADEYTFSIIIAVYNTEDYLSEAIDCIINQSFDFNKVQIVLVDDGSTDQSLNICKSYEKRFPKNILCISKENGGQSSARNLGLKYAKGKYVNFLDSDDKLELNTLQDVYSFFSQHDDELDVVVISRYNFGAINGPMFLDYKFRNTRVVDINEEFDFPQVSISAAFTRRVALPENFNTKLIISEDSLLINKTILDKCKFGVVGSAKYLYRKRPEETSTIDTKKTRKEYFIPRMNYYFDELINYSISKHGRVLKYIQTVLMYDLQWLFTQNTERGVLNDEELLEYKEHICRVLKVIDDDIILSQHFLNKYLEKYILDLKYGNPNFKNKYEESDIILEYNDLFFDKLSNYAIKISEIHLKYNLLYLVGVFDSCFNNISVNVNGSIPLKFNRIYGEELYSIGGKISNRFYFSLCAELTEGLNKISFEIQSNEHNYSVELDSSSIDSNAYLTFVGNNILINLNKRYGEINSLIDEKNKLNYDKTNLNNDLESMASKLDFYKNKCISLKNKNIYYEYKLNNFNRKSD